MGIALSPTYLEEPEHDLKKQGVITPDALDFHRWIYAADAEDARHLRLWFGD